MNKAKWGLDCFVHALSVSKSLSLDLFLPIYREILFENSAGCIYKPYLEFESRTARHTVSP